MSHPRFSAACLAGLLACAPVLAQSPNPGKAPDPLAALAEELVRLRGEVEALNTELNDAQQQHRAEMNSLAAQKGDLEATLRREELRVRQLEQDLADNRERASAAGIAGEALLPVVFDIVDALAAQIEQRFPFKREERLKALAEIRTQAESGALDAPRAINRLWRFYEDELRLTRDNGLYSQVIALGGDRVLADIAKIGAVALYFQTRDGRLGYAERNGEQWSYRVAESSAERKHIADLFESLKKQIRTGFFELPNGSIRPEASR